MLDFWIVSRLDGCVSTHLLMIVAVGAGVGFMGGLLGKGGSAIATPLLAAIGVPPIVALAAPLPATVPGTLVAADEYRRRGLIDSNVLVWSLVAGVPATVAGAVATRWIDARFLVLVTDVVITVLGLRMLLHRDTGEATDESVSRGRTIGVAVVTGLAAGLLANSGGFLLAPLFIAVLGLGIKPAFGTSLAVASVMAVPGTVVHLLLGHLDAAVVLAFGAGSIPLSRLGARVALRTDAARLERAYGLILVLLGTVFVWTALH